MPGNERKDCSSSEEFVNRTEFVVSNVSDSVPFMTVNKTIKMVSVPSVFALGRPSTAIVQVFSMQNKQNVFFVVAAVMNASTVICRTNRTNVLGCSRSHAVWAERRIANNERKRESHPTRDFISLVIRNPVPEALKVNRRYSPESMTIWHQMEWHFFSVGAAHRVLSAWRISLHRLCCWPQFSHGVGPATVRQSNASWYVRTTSCQTTRSTCAPC